MRWLIIALLVTACGVTAWLARSGSIGGSKSTEEKASVTWLESYPDALAKAKASGRPILADFTGSDWCDWCARLKDEVFSTKTFKEWAEANVVLLELDYPQVKPQSKELQKQNDDLAKKFNVEGFPMILLLNAEGVKLGQIGYEPGGPKTWIAALKTASGMK